LLEAPTVALLNFSHYVTFPLLEVTAEGTGKNSVIQKLIKELFRQTRQNVTKLHKITELITNLFKMVFMFTKV
jgi:hypothetical protein